MSSIAGADRAMRNIRTRNRRAMFLAMYMARKTWTITAAGRTIRNTGRCGSRRASIQVGLRINADAGFGWIITAGRGSGANHGAGLRITMDAGSMDLPDGHGGRERCMGGTTGGRRWSDFSAG